VSAAEDGDTAIGAAENKHTSSPIIHVLRVKDQGWLFKSGFKRFLNFATSGTD
jgi:hypothetical protein